MAFDGNGTSLQRIHTTLHAAPKPKALSAAVFCLWSIYHFRQMSLLSVGSEATGEGEYTHRMHERGSSKTQFWSMYQELICPTLTLGVTLVLPVANPS